MAREEDKESHRKQTYLYRYRHWLAGMAALVLVYAVLGFLVAPWALERMAVNSVRESLDSELHLKQVAINPFVLSLTIDGLEFADPTGEPLARADQVFANLQLSSVFRWALTFAEFRLDAPELFIARDAQGQLNFAYLLAGTAEEPEGGAEEATGLPRVLIHEFAINESALNWEDRLPGERVASRLGPVNIRILELNTLPQRSGQQTVVITTEGQGTLSWTGDLQLNPLLSTGKASLTGSNFELPARYLKQATGFHIVEGVSDVSLDYHIEVDEEGRLAAIVENLDVRFTDVRIDKSDPAAVPQDGAERRVLTLSDIHLAGGTVRWPEQEVRLEQLIIDSPDVAVYRDEQGRVNWLPAEGGENEPAEPAAANDGSADWQASLDKLEVRSLVFGLEDHGVQPPADIGLASLDLVVTGISNAESATFPATAEMTTREGGTISTEGEFQLLPELQAQVRVVAQGVALQLMQPYIRPLADVSMDSGDLGAEVDVTTTPDESLLVTGRVTVDDFLITETDEGSRLGSWDRLDLRGFDFALEANALNVSEVEFFNAYADIFIAEDGTVNLGRVEKGEQAATKANEETAATAPADPDTGTEDTTQAMDVLVGRVIFTDTGADFADNSLPLPFSARISELTGEISTVASASEAPSTVDLEGKVDEHGFVRISGSVTPLVPEKNTDLAVRFQNVEMPKFSAYSIPFAGREIANGRLDLDLGYELSEGRLVGENRIVLRDFELGEKVEHPDAMSLPLGLAVALLKDPSGVIDIELPVRGDLNDPEFKYGGVILKALANLIVKIVASPFALLGNLIGVEADELSQVNFIAGRADLTPPEEERIGKLAEALKLRPQLVLEVPGVVDQEADAHALAAMRVDELVDGRIGTVGEKGEASYAEQQREVLEALFAESEVAPDPGAALEELQQEFTTVPIDEDGQEGDPQFDAVAYTADLRLQLIEQQTIAESDLVALAGERVSAVRQALIALDPALEARVVTGETTAVDAEDDNVPMKVNLTAGAD